MLLIVSRTLERPALHYSATACIRETACEPTRILIKSRSFSRAISTLLLAGCKFCLWRPSWSCRSDPSIDHKSRRLLPCASLEHSVGSEV